MRKIAKFIIDKRKIIMLLFLAACALSLYTSQLTTVENNLYYFLDESTETRQGLKAMDGEFITYATAEIMLNDISAEDAGAVADAISGLEGVRGADFDETEDYKSSSALITVTFDGAETDSVSIEALERVNELLDEKIADADSISLYTEVGTDFSSVLSSEMLLIGALAVATVIALLLLTSRSYAEVPVLLITFLAAAMLQLGTNFVFESISYVSNAVTLILQLALAIDYAIILCHRFSEEKRRFDTYNAAIEALSKAIPEIASSSLTTIGGLIAMCFMQFGLGGDLGKVLIKSIFFSMLSVFLLMPGLLMTFSRAINKTTHRSFMPKINAVGRFAWKTHKIVPIVFIAVAIAAFWFSSKCPYSYNYSDVYPLRLNDNQKAHQEITETFGDSNMLALIVPSGDYEKEASMLDEISQKEHVASVLGIATVEAADGYRLSDELTLDEFASLAGLDDTSASALFAYYAAHNSDYEAAEENLDEYKVPLIDLFNFLYDVAQSGDIELSDEQLSSLESLHTQLSSAQEQLQGKKYSRMLVYCDTAVQSEETYTLIEEIHELAASYYGEDVYVTGDGTASRDLEDSFSTDSILINALSAVFVVLVIIIVFRSAGLAVLLIAVIQGSIWINFAVPYFTGNSIFFVGYLIVSAIQMGANIDYAIVVSNRYLELRERCSRRKAIRLALNGALPTLITSGSILVIAGLLIGFISTEGIIAVIGLTLGRGTIISLALVLFVLPQTLVWGDGFIRKSSFKRRKRRLAPLFSEDFEDIGKAHGRDK